MRRCACGRTRGLSDRPLDSFGAVPLMIGFGIVRFFYQLYFTQYHIRKRRSRRVQGRSESPWRAPQSAEPLPFTLTDYSAEKGMRLRAHQRAFRSPSGLLRGRLVSLILGRRSRENLSVAAATSPLSGETGYLTAQTSPERGGGPPQRWRGSLRRLYPIIMLNDAAPKGPGSIGKPLAHSVENAKTRTGPIRPYPGKELSTRSP